MSFFLGQLINGLKMGSIYALVGIGYSIVYGILGLINFAHGDLMMIATYSLWIMIAQKLPLWAGIIGAAVITALFAMGIERIAYRPLRKAGSAATLMTSLAVSSLLQNLCSLIFSPQNQALILPDFFSMRFKIGTVSLSMMNILTFIVTAVCMIVITLVMKKTRIGMAMRSCSDNLEASQLMGIDINHVIAFAFALGGVLAALAGMMYSGEYISFSNDMGFMIGVKAFVAVVIGGIGSIGGTVLGGLILGMLEMMLAGYLPSSMTSYRTGFVFLVLIIVLLVKPNGLFGAPAEERS